MKINLNIWQATTALLGVVALLLAWRLDNALTTAENLRKTQAVAEAQAIAEKASTEKHWQQLLAESEKRAISDQGVIEEAHQKALGSVDLDPASDPVGGLSNVTANSDGAEMPGASSASVGVSTEATKCDRYDRTELQRLYKKQLALARDCDITAHYYNEILTLWERIRGSNTAAEKE